MGRDGVFRSGPPRSVPGQLFTLARQSWIAIFRLDLMYARRSTKTRVPLTLVISFRAAWFSVDFDLGIANNGWTYKESYNECCRAIRVLHRQCCFAAHVEG